MKEQAKQLGKFFIIGCVTELGCLAVRELAAAARKYRGASKGE